MLCTHKCAIYYDLKISGSPCIQNLNQNVPGEVTERSYEEENIL